MKRLYCSILSLLILFAASISAAADKAATSFIPPETPWAAQGSPAPLPARQHPLLFLSATDFAKLKQRVQTQSWAASEFAKLIAAADNALKRPLDIPAQPGEWSHHYVCKTCGIGLQHVGGKNVCPRCHREYSGWPYDGVVAGRKHHQNIDDAESLALAWQFTGKTPYADKCRNILLGYADRYTKYPIHDFSGGTAQKGARLFAQTLDEAVRMIPLVWAYDMIYNTPAMTPADRSNIEYKLFRPAALIIRRNDMSISNWQSWHNAAIACIGYVLNDAAMVDHAINGKSGINFQMKHSVLPDGFWYEGTAAYHFYALQALEKQAMAMKAAGMNLYAQPVYKSLYEAPLDYLFPDGRFPAVNDSNAISISSQAEFYEIAYAWYKEPQFAAAARKGSRNSRKVFLWGADSLPPVEMPTGISRNFPGLGAAMLRQTANPSNPLALHIDYGPHGGGHGHPDKLGIVLFANGHEIIPDPGRLAYAAPLHKRWYKTTLAHNTVIVDGKNQRPATGKIVSASFQTPVKLATVACDTAYDDVALTRGLALAPGYLLDVVSGASPDKHTWDLAYHVNATPSTSLNLQPATLPQKKRGYQVLKNIRKAMVPAGSKSKSDPAKWTMTFRDTDKSGDQLTLVQASPREREVILADGVTGGNVTICPVVLSRTRAANPTWITLIVPGNATEADLTYRQVPDGWEIAVNVGGRNDRYSIRHGEISMIGLNYN